MQLIFSGNDFKYELEGVMKLFIPARLFDIEYEDNLSLLQGDYAFIRRKVVGDKTLLYVICSYNNKTTHKSGWLSSSVQNYENECELALSRYMYICMKKLTTVEAGWGIITGIRPVKRVNEMLDKHMSRDEIFTQMRSRWLCSDSKTEIAYQTALTQKPCLDTLDDNSFSLYVSIPFCPTRCSYCSFVSQSVESAMKLIPEYVDNLVTELELTAKMVKRLGLKLDTVYFGGGTPTTLEACQLELLMNTIAENFDLASCREYTVEAGRPDTVTKEKLAALKRCGATRISVNPQSLNDTVLETIGRNHTTQQFFDSYKLAKSFDFDSINTDIIAGLPSDTYESFCHTVDKLIELAPDNITVHTLSIKRAARLNHQRDDNVLENPAGKMVEYASRRLSESGYKPYYLYRQKNMLDNQENIGWAKDGKESLYNVYIMEEVQTILAVGAGGSTKLCDRRGHRLERVFNYKFPLEYNKHFDLMLEKKKEIEAFYAKEK